MNDLPHLSFIYPEMLWLLWLPVLIAIFTLLLVHRLSPVRFWLSVGIRLVLMIALVLSLAGTQVVFPVDHLTTVFLIDSSDSVAPSSRGRAEAFVQEALKNMQQGDKAGIVVFGEDALVERVPNSQPLLGKLMSVPSGTFTNIEKALQLGMALFPAETQKRMVLLSDGGENAGQSIHAARVAAARNIPIDIVDLSGDISDDEALISSLKAPVQAHNNQRIELLITIESNREQQAHLRLFADQTILTDQYVALLPGNNQFRFPTTVEGQGFRRYRAQIEPQYDGRVQNNEAAALVHVLGPPRVLLVEGKKDEARNLHDGLQASAIHAETVDPTYLPTTLNELSGYEAIVLVNVPAYTLSPKAMSILPSYVRDMGKGLVMIGGTESYGVGGYLRTPIEEALPVYMDVRDKQERPNLAIVFVIDKSGSMDACHCAGPGGQTAQVESGSDRKIDIAKEAVTQASGLLGQQDSLTVVAFDQQAYQVFPPTQGPNPADVAEAVSRMEPRGGTNIQSGLLQAETILAQSDARIKHVVLLTDGWGGSNSSDTVRRMKDAGITLSIVAAGSGSADYLERLAKEGAGRYYPAQHMRDVPQIFLQETITAAGNYLIEQPFLPAITFDNTLLRGLQQNFPMLYGYNGTTLKERARAMLVSDTQLPILAEWNYGLGRTIAWTSDMKGKWARDLVAWEKFPQFAAQLVEWVIPTTISEQMTTDIQIEGTQTIIVAKTNEPHQNLDMVAKLIKTTDQQKATPSEITLSQVAPGEYRASVTTPMPGTYLLQVQGREQEQVVAQHIAGFVVPYSPEYQRNQKNPGVLEELRHVTQGNTLHKPSDSFLHNLSAVVHAQEISFPLLIFVLILIPFDIAVRRLILRREDVIKMRHWLSTYISPKLGENLPPDPALAQLAQAKQRARRAKHPGASRELPTTDNASSKTAHLASPQPPPYPPQQTSAKEPPPEDPLERLRLAKERARRRARGEEG